MNKKLFIKIITIAFFGGLFVLLSFLFYQGFRSQTTISSDIKLNLFFSENFANTMSFSFVDPLNNEFKEKIFGSEGFFINSKGETTHNSFHGFLILLGLTSAYWPFFVYLAVPIMAIICLIYFFKLCSIFLNKNIAIALTGLLALSGSFFFWSTTLFNNIPTLAFFIASLYYFFMIFKTGGMKNYILFACMTGITIWMRYPEAVLYGAMILPTILMRKKLEKKKVIISLLVLCTFVFSLIMLNYHLYGNIFGFLNNADGLIYNRDVVEEMVYKPTGILPFISLDLFKKNFIDFFVKINPVLFLIFVLGVVVFFIQKKKNEEFRNVFFLTIFSVILINVLFYCGGIFSGFGGDQVDVGVTYPRYFLPAYALMTLVGGICLSWIKNKKVVILLLGVFAVFNIDLAINSPNGFGAYKDNVEYRNQERQFYLRIIPNGSIVFIKDYSMLLYPERAVAHYSALPIKNRAEIMTEMILKMQEKRPVYFIVDGHEKNSELYFQEFKKNGLRVQIIEKNVYNIYLPQQF